MNNFEYWFPKCTGAVYALPVENAGVQAYHAVSAAPSSAVDKSL